MKKTMLRMGRLAIMLCLVLTLAVGMALAENYTVTFDLNLDEAGDAPAAQTVPAGGNAEEPEEPSMPGYVFYEWTTDRDGFNSFDFDKAINGDITLYASWGEAYTITFDYNYAEAPEAAVVNVEMGEAVEEPEAPVREGYVFTGWYSDASAVTAYDFEEVPSDNMTLYAGWNNPNASYVTVTFDLNDGVSAPLTAQIEPGTAVSAPSNAVRDESHAIAGWFADKEKTVPFDFSQPITEDVTVFAKWDAVLEAEYTDVSELKGVEYSSNFAGTNMIEADTLGYGASGGHYLTYIYLHNTKIVFTFNADRADNAAKLTLRVGSALDFELSGKTYKVEVNGKKLSYNGVELTEEMNFIDVDLGKISLVEGENTIVLTTIDTRDEPMGLITDNAPIVDCIRIATDAEITWNPVLDNVK